jgi:hypothetical protein
MELVRAVLLSIPVIFSKLYRSLPETKKILKVKFKVILTMET